MPTTKENIRKKAPELPATTLEDYCHEEMFSGCTRVTQVPELLPATTLPKNCYCSIFESCKEPTQAPELPATERSTCSI